MAATLGELLSSADARQLYTRMHTHWKQPESVVVGGRLPSTCFYETDA